MENCYQTSNQEIIEAVIGIIEANDSDDVAKWLNIHCIIM